MLKMGAGDILEVLLFLDHALFFKKKIVEGGWLEVLRWT